MAASSKKNPHKTFTSNHIRYGATNYQVLNGCGSILPTYEDENNQQTRS